jgi:hypothetical protein
MDQYNDILLLVYKSIKLSIDINTIAKNNKQKDIILRMLIFFFLINKVNNIANIPNINIKGIAKYKYQSEPSFNKAIINKNSSVLNTPIIKEIINFLKYKNVNKHPI